LIKIGIVAEVTAMRLGLREVLNNQQDITVVLMTQNLESLPHEPLDVLLVVQNSCGFQVENNQAVLFLTDDQPEIQKILKLELSTWGVLPINASEEELSVAIHALAEGLWVGSPGLIRELLKPIPAMATREKELSLQALTPREKEVLQMASQGYANKQIAELMGISEHTIKFHLSSLYAKLRVTNRTEALRTGVINGLIVM